MISLKLLNKIQTCNKETAKLRTRTADLFDMGLIQTYFSSIMVSFGRFFSREVEVDLPKEDLVMIKLATYSHGYVIFYVKLLPHVTDGKLKT